MVGNTEAYSPFELGEIEAKKYILKGDDGHVKRKYLGVRYAPYYRGSLTADTEGCNLRCAFCWAPDNKALSHPGKEGKFYSPKDISVEMFEYKKTISRNIRCFRVSHGEPTLSKSHLLSLLRELEKYQVPVLIETNGIILGKDGNFVKELSYFKNIHLRVSLKGANPKKFMELTGAREDFYNLQLKSLERCLNNQVDAHPAIMLDFIRTKKEFKDLQSSLENIEKNLSGKLEIKLIKKLEFERLLLWPLVKKNLEEKGLAWMMEAEYQY
jgi:uncharacterized Fe-S cluster-containing radical SAM superfamily protein